MRRLVALGIALALLVGCGDNGGDDTSAVPTGGTSTAGGSAPSGGTSNSGESNGGTSSGAGSPGNGGAVMGGKTGVGDTQTGGLPTTGGLGGRGGMSGGTGGGTSTGGAPSAPDGPVDTCRGDTCPLGPCDNGRFFSDEKCSDVYPGPVSEGSMFCAADSEGGYCLNTITNVITYWAITCTAGEPSFELCKAGCGLAANVAKCN